MNDILFVVVPIVTIAVCAGVWNLVRELFTRWANNDWCKHDWGVWESVERLPDTILYRQIRFCKKCNKAERRLLQ
jgi:hypothetical protein